MEGFVISIKNNEWAEEFKRLNSCLELKRDIENELSILDELSVKNAKIQHKSGIIAILIFFIAIGTLYSSFFFRNYVSAVLYLISQISLGFFVLLLFGLAYIFLYENDIKMKKKRSKIYFKFLK